jgi:hypothetical protein
VRRLVSVLVPLLVPVLVLVLAGCSGTEQSVAPTPVSPGSPSESDPAPTPDPPGPAPEPGTVPPPWLGTRVLPLTDDGGYGEVRPTPPALRERRFTLPDRLDPLPGDGFAARVADPAPDEVIARSTWEPSCPVGRDALVWVRVAFRGFDGSRHTGELLVASSVADDVVGVFRDLWRAGFAFEELRITTKAELDVPPTGDGNNTGGFVCRPVTGGTSYSQHAYGTALDLNPFQNPYAKGDVVLPELASSYLDRSWVRPGMITADGPVVRAFARIGWGWGGAWSSLLDYQHFSLSGS